MLNTKLDGSIQQLYAFIETIYEIAGKKHSEYRQQSSYAF